MRKIRVQPPVYLLMSAGLMGLLHRYVPIVQWIGWPWRWVGLAVMAAGLGLGVSSVVLFRRHRTTIRPGQASKALLTAGPFGFSRNPIYLGMVVLLAGLAVLLGSVSAWIVLPLFVAAIATRIVPVEEAMLSDTFGDEYAAYKRRVRRWI